MVPSVKDQRIPSRRLQDNKVAGDEMWSIKAAIDLGEPVHVAFRRVYTGMALGYDFSAPDAINERQDLPPAPRLSPALWHGVQAGLWNMIGSSTLASIHEDMAFTSPDLDDETRLEVLLARADRVG
jgi:anaphase-promoting complex subunit 5